MSLFGIWNAFGLSENPYNQATLKPDAEGDDLLVGRDQEVALLQAAVGSGGTHPTVEGPVGAGKSSLIAVASYRMLKTSLDSRAEELYVPAPRFFQVQADLDAFVLDVYLGVAQALVQNVTAFSHVGLPEPLVGELGRWLNAPEFVHWSGSATIAGFGGGGGYGVDANETEGFLRSGFPELVLGELARCFPDRAGGVVCVLDNLELLQSAGQARQTLDELRDRLFNIPQLRWVLCGSRGIVSRARSERLSGIFQAPQVLGPLEHDSVVEAIQRRISRYSLGNEQEPVTPEGFEFLYRALNRNLRDSLSTAQEFGLWLYSQTVQLNKPIPSENDRFGYLEAWLAERAESAHRDARGVQPRHWQFFADLCARGGRTPSSDFDAYGFTTQQQFTAAITALVQSNLMVRETDPDDGARTLNGVTALGWLVYFFRNNFDLPNPGA